MTQRKASAEKCWPVRSSKINDATVISINGFEGPYDLSVTDSGRIYVADVRDGRIIRFSEKMAFEKWLGYSTVLSKFYSAKVTLVRIIDV